MVSGLTIGHRAWDLWIKGDSTVVVLLRGTTADMRSILADFYVAMVPASGVINFSPDEHFEYQLATHERAAVHAGFLIGFAYMARDMTPKIDSLYGRGYRDFLIAGHSQGGALAYYVSAWLRQHEKHGQYPSIQVKTYASAAPKIGNMYFAYDYDNMTMGGWTFSIINSDDAIPELPFTTQQVDIDMNEPNPILGLMTQFDKLPFFQRVVMKRAFRKMIRNASRSSKSYNKYLGAYPRSFVTDALPDLAIPAFFHSTYFVRPGISIPLMVNEQYLAYFSDASSYYHHGLIPYRFLLRQYFPDLPEMTKEEESFLMKGFFSIRCEYLDRHLGIDRSASQITCRHL